MLNALGAGIGANTVDATARDTPSASSFGIGAAIWLLISNLIGLGVGGYVAARLSGTSDNTDGTLHGLAVWGTSFLISAVLLGNLVSGIASTAASGASSVILPHILGPIDAVARRNVTWEAVAEHTEMVLAFGGMALKNSMVASGGITELADLEVLQGLVPEGVEGAIIGTALYEGRFTLEDALALTRKDPG